MAAHRGCAVSSPTHTSMAAGLKVYFLPTERLWINAELFRVDRAPYSGAFTPLYRRDDGLGADGSDGPRFLTITGGRTTSAFTLTSIM